jgi:hypothetical protein
LESVIVFTSQLRLDPKQVDLSYWWFSKNQPFYNIYLSEW